MLSSKSRVTSQPIESARKTNSSGATRGSSKPEKWRGFGKLDECEGSVSLRKFNRKLTQKSNQTENKAELALSTSGGQNEKKSEKSERKTFASVSNETMTSTVSEKLTSLPQAPAVVNLTARRILDELGVPPVRHRLRANIVATRSVSLTSNKSRGKTELQRLDDRLARRSLKQRLLPIENAPADTPASGLLPVQLPLLVLLLLLLVYGISLVFDFRKLP